MRWVLSKNTRMREVYPGDRQCCRSSGSWSKKFKNKNIFFQKIFARIFGVSCMRSTSVIQAIVVLRALYPLACVVTGPAHLVREFWMQIGVNFVPISLWPILDFYFNLVYPSLKPNLSCYTPCYACDVKLVSFAIILS